MEAKTGNLGADNEKITSGARGRHKLEKAMNRMSPRASGGSPGLLTPGFWTSGLQNLETTHFCCFRPPSVW